MKQNKWAVLSTALTLFLLCGCTASIAPSSQHTVAIVAKSTQTEFWLSVFAGAEAAATEYNVELIITGPKAEEDYETQNQMVANAVDAGAEAWSSPPSTTRTTPLLSTPPPRQGSRS